MRRRFELILILRETLKRVEEESNPDDPTLLKLKSSLLQAIADFELLTDEEERCA